MKVGIVGCGGIGRRHLLSYRNCGLAPTALADAVPESAKAAAAEWGGTAYGDYREMFARGGLDAISICTPPSSHREIAAAALQAGIAVLCEKPMASTLEDAEAMAQAAERAETLFMIGHCHRFQPHIEKLRELIDADEIGVVRMFRSRFGFVFRGVENAWFSDPEVAGGGILLDTHVHSVDIFRFLVGEVEEVSALWSTVDTPLGPALRVEDSAVLTARTREGVLGVMEASWRTAPGESRVTVYGTGGSATVDYGTNELMIHKEGEDSPNVVEVTDANRFDREIAHFLAAVRGAEAPRLTAADGVAAIRILTGAYSSRGVAVSA